MTLDFSRPHPTTLVALRAGREVGRWTWEVLDGATAVVSLTRFDTAAVETELARTAVEVFREEGYRYVQLPIHEEATDANHLIAVGFRNLTTLTEYRRSSTAAPPPRPLPAGLRLEPIGDLNDDELSRLWHATLIGTLDCPELNACRGPTGLPAGFADPRIEQPETAFAVRMHGESVGLIIGAVHSDESFAAILYLGVIPAVRRIGAATALLSHFLSSTRVASALGCTVTVDVRNVPARRLYERNRFRPCGSYRISVWINSSAT